MRRAIVAVLLMAGCTTIESHPIEQPMQSPAERAWQDNVFPMLVTQCAQCHRYNDVGFLDGDNLWEVRETLVASGMVNLENPASSRLVLIGPTRAPG